MAASMAFSQALPFKYQAVIRNSDGEVLDDKNVGLRVSIVQDTNNVVVYTEEFNQTSDKFGIIDLEVGTGNVLSGNYLTIDWSKPANQLKIEVDMNGGTTFNLPDLRGMFLRGAKLGRADAYKDPDVSNRDANGFGDTDDVGSLQIDQFGSHKHSMSYETGNVNDYLGGSTATYGVNPAFVGNNFPNILSASGGSETRPNNIYINYIIKY